MSNTTNNQSELIVLITQAAKAKGALEDGEATTALAELQDFLGVETGDVAGMFFSCEKSEDWKNLDFETKISMLSNYVATEIRYLIIS
ncbi:hypothetical protein AB6D66_01405 [Vibrio pomeroyi]|uniref:Uncharacterized protein n=1 Tax=Vibrio pomeroyi TaxID=198832 RepID=A0ABV4MRD1_9VIBR|nr:hypothetical protein [Vibrio atlanticus]MCZ4310219.1 hypothetical protein [Vibrio atlanticus]